ncbi:Uncharacterised protein [Mycobacteroides abscessus]|nr:Uncharacterised protein [Mycobacteroides abscessus]
MTWGGLTPAGMPSQSAVSAPEVGVLEARYERVMSMGKAKMLAWPKLIRMLVCFGKPGPIPGVTLIAAPCVSRATGMEKVPMTVAGRPG